MSRQPTTHPTQQPRSLRAHRWLAECSDEIAHPEPSRALSLGLYAVLQTVQTAIVFDRVPAELGDARFVEEMALMFRRYLGVAGPTAASG